MHNKFQQNKNPAEKRRKLKKSNGRSIFKRKKGKLRKVFNKSDNKKTKDSESAGKSTKEDVTGAGSGEAVCKYSSGKVNGLEKCIGCGVGYRYKYKGIIHTLMNINSFMLLLVFICPKIQLL